MRGFIIKGQGPTGGQVRRHWHARFLLLFGGLEDLRFNGRAGTVILACETFAS